MNRQVELVDALVDGGFGLDQEQFKDLMSEYAGTIADKVDVILFAQGSMAYLSLIHISVFLLPSWRPLI